MGADMKKPDGADAASGFDEGRSMTTGRLQIKPLLSGVLGLATIANADHAEQGGAEEPDGGRKRDSCLFCV